MTVRAAAKRARGSVSRSLPAASLSARRRAPSSGTGDKSLAGFVASCRRSPSTHLPKRGQPATLAVWSAQTRRPHPASRLSAAAFFALSPAPVARRRARCESQAGVSAGGGGCCAAGGLGRWGGWVGVGSSSRLGGDLARQARRAAAHEVATAWPAVSPSFGAPCSPTTVSPALSWRVVSVFFFFSCCLWSQ